MSGAYGGVQALMRQKAPNARYIHCAAHALNLVIYDAVKNVRVEKFFWHVQKTVRFLQCNRLQKECTCPITLKRLCPIRWSSRNQALIALRSRFVDVMKLLALLSLSGKNSDEKCVAVSLQKYFERFSSVVIVILPSQILGPLDIISKQLQSKSSNLSMHHHCSATVTSPGLACTAKWLGNNSVLCQGAGRELGHQERLFCF